MSHPENRLLAALPAAERDRLRESLTNVSLGVRDTLYTANGSIDHVYFPRSGVMSIVVVLEDGAMSEVGVIGREGLVGVPAWLGADCSPHRVFCQVPGEAWRMRADVFRAEVRQGGPLGEAVQRYTQAYLFQVSQSTACNHHHPVEARLARWLLMSHDRAGGSSFPMTHEFLSIMLGVRRPSVTLAAGTLQAAGLIRYTRGKVTVTDRPGLEETACECYRVVRAYYDAVLR